MTDQEIRRLEKTRATESAGRAAAAAASPLRSSGAGGWKGNTPTMKPTETSAPSGAGSGGGPAPDFAPDPSRATRPTRSYGVNEGDQGSSLTREIASPLAYLGHLANDDVATEGHNIGARAKGAVTNPTIAHRGFRKLPGSASDTCGQAKPIAADLGMDTMPGSPPVSKRDLRMSIEHHKDSIAFEQRHLRDHRRGFDAASRAGDAESASYHKSHLTEHEGRRDTHEKQLAERSAQLRDSRRKR